MSARTRYALFRWDVEQRESSGLGWITFTIGNDTSVPGDEWKDGDNADEDGPKKRLVFVGFCNNPQAVVELIRKNPTAEYVLMQGEMHPVQVAMPVFIRGKNLMTLSSEWAEDAS